jgi:membrane-associated protease RseP (regulator of RpoE activity)
MKGVITQIDTEKILTYESLSDVMKKYRPNETITVTTKLDKDIKEYKLVLGEDPSTEGRAIMGIGYVNNRRSGAIGKIVEFFNFYQKPGTFYEPRFNSDLVLFIYNLFWWLALINLSVAIVNMMPLALFDGGRTFMLTMWAITGSKKFGELAFKFMTYLILGALVLIMLGWAWALYGI